MDKIDTRVQKFLASDFKTKDIFFYKNTEIAIEKQKKRSSLHDAIPFVIDKLYLAMIMD